MLMPYRIGTQVFLMRDQLGASFMAIAEARRLMREGHSLEANRLYDAAVQVRRELSMKDMRAAPYSGWVSGCGV